MSITPEPNSDKQYVQDLYKVETIIAIERYVFERLKLPQYELMCRAGKAVFDLLKARYPEAKSITVICGAGNNAGDGYVLARLAQQDGIKVRLVSLIDTDKHAGAARQACDDWLSIGTLDDSGVSVLQTADVIVDAMLGTGLSRNLDEHWQAWIEAVNEAGKPVIAIDLPSGLYADTGAASNAGAIHAEVTLSFIGLKQGLYTGVAGDYCGEILLDKLGLHDDVYRQFPADAQLVRADQAALFTASMLQPRPASSHKGSFGHVLVAGGNRGMPGAVILAASAALRTGAGKVSIVTHSDNLAAVAGALPEAMVRHADNDDRLAAMFDPALLAGISHIVLGPGLGTDDWSRQVFEQVMAAGKPVVLDADGLNMLAEQLQQGHLQQAQQDKAGTAKNWSVPQLLITPHPGEARRLLVATGQDEDISAADRFQCARAIHHALTEQCQLNHPDAQVCVVLKGSGTLVYTGELFACCGAGNAAMASAGMGDVLSGIIAGLWAQQKQTLLDLHETAFAGVCLHAASADHISKGRTRGLIASDIIRHLKELLP